MAESILICIFAKPPVPGQAKTRLAAKIGEVRAADLARAFLRDTCETVSRLGWAEGVVATTEGTACELGVPGSTRIWLQGGGDLGARIERIMKRGLAQADSVIAIGADTPGLPNRLLDQAREALARADAVLGPSDDGGFYLLGLRRCPSGLFSELPWSDATTFDATKRRIEQCGVTLRTIEPWFDVDHPADLTRLRLAIERGDVRAQATARLLAASSRGEVRCW